MHTFRRKAGDASACEVGHYKKAQVFSESSTPVVADEFVVMFEVADFETAVSYIERLNRGGRP